MRLMPFFAIGINHHTAPVPVREQLAFATPELPQTLQALVSAGVGVTEVAILSTCNRTECYAVADDPQAVFIRLCTLKGVKTEEVAPHLFIHRELAAVRHLFRVAAGLDSMVLGETQIVGQFKEAYRQAQRAGTMGKHLEAVMQSALAVAKEVRSRTAIGANVVSMAAAAVRLAQRVFGPVSEQRLLFLGAGEMIETCLAHFAAGKPRAIFIVNRTVSRAAALAERFGGLAYGLEQLSELLPECDTIVASTASPLPLIGLGMVERALKRRRHRPFVMVDLAVPRDIEPEVGQLQDVYLYSVDDLALIVQEGRESRVQAVRDAEAIIDARLADFATWMSAQEMVPLIRHLRSHAEAIAAAETERALARLRAGADPEGVVRLLAHSLTNKWLHAPTTFLKNAPPEARRQLIDWAPALFGWQQRSKGRT